MAQIDEAKLGAFIGKMLGDLGGAYSVPTTRIGLRLGLFDALHTNGPLDPAELAARAGGLSERYVREWCLAQAANGYITFDSASGQFSLTPEQSMVFAVSDSPVYMAGGFDLVAAMIEGEPRVEQAFREGTGVRWGESAGCLFCAVGAFFRPSYANHLVQSWLPALDGVQQKLKDGAKVADIGCGVGFSTLMMAEAFPNSRFIGFDFHEPSILAASEHARAHGLADRVRFETVPAKAIEESDFDLITVFDCLHDMGDPKGCAAHVRTLLKPDGTWMIVEPIASDQQEDNIASPVGRLFYNASTMICVPTSMDQEVGEALGAQAGEARISALLKEAGLSRVRRAAETPFNMILEARP